MRMTTDRLLCPPSLQVASEESPSVPAAPASFLGSQKCYGGTSETGAFPGGRRRREPLQDLARRRSWRELESHCLWFINRIGGEGGDDNAVPALFSSTDNSVETNPGNVEESAFLVPPILSDAVQENPLARLFRCLAAGLRETCGGNGESSSYLSPTDSRILSDDCADALFESLPRDPPARVVSQLISLYAYVNPRESDGLLLRRLRVSRSIPLHVACYSMCSPGVIRALVDACPSSVLLKNKVGWTPLALMCWSIRESRAKSELLASTDPLLEERLCEVARTLLLMACANEVGRKGHGPLSLRRRAAGVIGLRDNIGWTPLHISCWAGAPAALVQLLLEECPPSRSPGRIRAREGWTPLHVACRYSAGPPIVRLLLKSYPRAVAMTAGDGWFPLTLACYWGASSGAIRELLLVDPSSASARSWGDCTPLEVLWYFHERKKLMTNLGGTDAHVSSTVLPIGSNYDTEGYTFPLEASRLETRSENDDFIVKTSLLLCAMHRGSIPKEPDLTSSILPALRVAAMAISPSISCPQEARDYALRRIMRVSQEEAAKMVLVYNDDSSGLPRQRCHLLHKAIIEGLCWTDGLSQIFHAFPDALRARDEGSSLYPFALAASIDDAGKNSSLAWLNTVYHLLIYAPEVLQES